ncbi:MAG: DUF3445 domain-containing protein [Rhodobacteraceae bacterium]|nr:DUF3445 domain-containing protein [Paracoccaceae bacterium]
MAAILQRVLPYDIASDAGLPGVRPQGADDWISVDDAYGAQMAHRAALLRARRADVVQLAPEARPAADELLDRALALAARRPDLGFHRDGGTVLRPDGVRVTLDPGDPMGTLGHLFQEDFCILQAQGGQHVLTGAVLCFPASWRLDEKFMRPLDAIHTPVVSYDADVARRVQRLFDGVRAGRPLWRYNILYYSDPELHQPRSVVAPRREKPGPGDVAFLRSERQSIVRLETSGAVVFAIHTYVVEMTGG